MQINLDDETERADIEALERVRVRLGERSGRATVKRLIRDADAGGSAASIPAAMRCRLPAVNPSDSCALPAKHSGPCGNGGRHWTAPSVRSTAAAKLAKRKGARS